MDATDQEPQFTFDENMTRSRYVERYFVEAKFFPNDEVYLCVPGTALRGPFSIVSSEVVKNDADGKHQFMYRLRHEETGLVEDGMLFAEDHLELKE
ncbi:hypothetical protein QBC43DRAFT_307955 [Cladorrhinum sp. PSN259]|nr:hypothetical protein QBC43DRAFT_307955 [Cladorrhinum sp. PSN259]